MPTIQEEMSKILNEWDKPEPQPTESTTMPNPNMKNNSFGVTNNVTRVTFEHVKNNPGCTATEASNVLTKLGYKHSSVTSIMAQLYRQGQMRKSGYKYYVTADEYVPLKGSYKAKKQAKKEREAKKLATGGIATLPKVAVPAPAPKSSVQDLMDSLTLREARELYLELAQYFGE